MLKMVKWAKNEKWSDKICRKKSWVVKFIKLWKLDDKIYN